MNMQTLAGVITGKLSVNPIGSAYTNMYANLQGSDLTITQITTEWAGYAAIVAAITALITTLIKAKAKREFTLEGRRNKFMDRLEAEVVALQDRLQKSDAERLKQVDALEDKIEELVRENTKLRTQVIELKGNVRDYDQGV